MLADINLVGSAYILNLKLYNSNYPFTLCEDTTTRSLLFNMCGSLRDLVPFAPFKNVKNTHAGVLKRNTPPWVFFTFFKCTNSTKSRKATHINISLRI